MAIVMRVNLMLEQMVAISGAGILVCPNRYNTSPPLLHACGDQFLGGPLVPL
jgi:hypothetical protein